MVIQQTAASCVAVKVNYKNVPHYYNHCHKLGHLELNCLAKGNTEHGAVRDRDDRNGRRDQGQGNGNKMGIQRNHRTQENHWERVGQRRNNRRNQDGIRGGFHRQQGRGGGGRGRGIYLPIHHKQVYYSGSETEDYPRRNSNARKIDVSEA